MLYQLFVYVPIIASEKVKNALFDAGAGRYENYDQCSWESSGVGQFRPLEGSNPFLGSLSTLEKVEEIKIEMICKPEILKAVLKRLKEVHPYEEPAYGVIEFKTIEDF
ncbi:NGG1p interacting factor NIF3 [Sulfuricurvum sp.]|uniref:NGG1p interacting factor NIF3 n=1 Tax=Sulfuricurvum sp. TaxID=2025608 RepID=UPI0026200E82|nr:NGG1p interacting factor NIF3 [Sulfuricurvum sp.]MDD2266510.1 NGG1p interacting factor NIF3 [Sulfuricurvum sp.]MDD2783984.1 NGG1p interacting factor NIF3 [Sulfuricurvum sp.]HZF69605.1 NGG1p interacting factor NIF3 [Sulfuricurvum sp.]